ncbi:hypothetical protein MMC25_007671 [Agyrium rufum]|nr:hypothetical protein [Agyrium rufum]
MEGSPRSRHVSIFKSFRRAEPSSGGEPQAVTNATCEPEDASKTLATTRAPFETLPYEILNQILGYVQDTQGKRSFKALRSTNKYFAIGTAPYIFNRISLSDKSVDLDVFAQWTSNPLLASCVREIAYNIDPMIPGLTRELYTYALLLYLIDVYRGVKPENFQDPMVRDLLSWRCIAGKPNWDYRPGWRIKARPIDIRPCKRKRNLRAYKRDLLFEQRQMLLRERCAGIANFAEHLDTYTYAHRPHVWWPPEDLLIMANNPIIIEGHRLYLEEAQKCAALRSMGEANQGTWRNHLMHRTPKGPTFHEQLTMGFKKCPNIKKLTLTIGDARRAIGEHILVDQGPDWRKWRDRDGRTPFLRSWNLLYLPPSWIGPSMQDPNQEMALSRNGTIEIYNILPDIRLLITALCESNVTIEELQANPLTGVAPYQKGDWACYQEYYRGQSLSCLPASLKTATIIAFGSLKSLDLYLYARFHKYTSVTNTPHGLVSIIPHLPHLEH